MAVTFNDSGRENLKNRECHFKNGRPTNPDVWPAFKNIPEKLAYSPTSSIIVSKELILACFNPILDSYTNRTVRSSMDQFKAFCDEHCLDVEHMNESDKYKISLDFDKGLTKKPKFN